VLYLIAWCSWGASSTMKHEGLQARPSFKMCFFNINSHCIKSNFIYQLVIIDAIGKPWQWCSNTIKVKRWYRCTLVPKSSSMKNVPSHQNFNNQTICNGVCMPIVKGKSFVLSSFYKKICFSKCSKTHICTFIWSLVWRFLTPFPHLIFIMLDSLFESKIIFTSFFFPRNHAWYHIFLCSLYICLMKRPLSNYSWIQAFNSIEIQFA